MKRRTPKEKLVECFEFMKDTIVADCLDERHIAAICGSIGRLDTKQARQIFKEWLEENKIKYNGNL